MVLIKAKEKRATKFDESFTVDSGTWFPWQLIGEVTEQEELSAALPHHPQLFTGF